MARKVLRRPAPSPIMTIESPILISACMHRSIGTLGHVNFGGAESLFCEFDQLGHAWDNDIGSYRVVTLGNWFYFGCHAAIVRPNGATRIVKILSSIQASGT